MNQPLLEDVLPLLPVAPSSDPPMTDDADEVGCRPEAAALALLAPAPPPT